MTKALDEGYGSNIIYLDCRKAFDTVPHQKLLLKLRSFGMPDDIVNWIAAFLLESNMRVGVNDAFSSWTKVESHKDQCWDHPYLSFSSMISQIGLIKACGSLWMILKFGVL